MPESCDVVLGISGELWVRRSRHSSSEGDGSSPARKAAAGLALVGW